MKRSWSLVLLFFCSPAAFASSAKIWVTDTTREFSAGTAHGVSAEPAGDLVLALRSAKVEGISSPTILSAVEEPSGAIDIGTGDGGQVLRAEPGKAAVLLATLPEKEVTALAVGRDGAIFAGTSPKGKVYRIEKGKSSEYFDPKAEYIWALVFDAEHTLFVGTGIPGKIARVVSSGRGSTYFDSVDEHIRSLRFDRKGRLWAGTASRGLLLRFDSQGKAQTIYDSQRTEISSIAEDRAGNVFAAAVSGHGAPPSAPGRPQTPPPAAPKEKKAEPGAPDEGNATVTVTVSTSPVAPPPAPPAPRGAENSEIVEVSADDSVAVVWQSEEEMVYSTLFDEAKDGLLLGTGPKGRLYSLRDGQLSLGESFDEKRILVVLKDALVTDSPPSAYRRRPAIRGEYFSPIKDTGRTSRFGAFRSESVLPSKSSVAFSFRSGNSSLPDGTWSDWSAPVAAPRLEKIPAPPGRFLQWRATLEAPDPGRSPSLSRVECAYRNQNARPTVEAVSAGVIATHDPGAVPAASTDREPGGETIFTSADERPSGGSSTSRWENRGFLIVSWKATDPDGDELSADVDFRPEGSPKWVPMRQNLKGSSFGFDSSLLPDGRYVFRVTLSDAASNPDDPKSDSRDSDPILIDNTPPRIEVIPPGRNADRGVIHVRVSDASSPLAAVLWSVNAGPWSRANADDGMTDSPAESYTIKLNPSSRTAYLLIRALDAAGNAASTSVPVP
jgi:ligand-binding sensor domain-containing protein